MKIEKLLIENITSLRGEHCIDFKTLLKSDDLFAITGATGSGKSSLLTAISLALYGKGHKKGLNAEDFVSSGSDKARIELSFRYQGKLYKAQWLYNALGARGKRLANAETSRTLYCADELLETKASDLIGLSFDQFNRTVILNQGEFAKFLNGSFAERKKILERLYDGENLGELSKALRQKIKDLEGQKQTLDQIIDSMMPVSEEQHKNECQIFENLTNEKDALELEFEQVQNSFDELKLLVDILKTLQDKEKRIADYELQLTEKSNKFFVQQVKVTQAHEHEKGLEEKEQWLRPLIDQGLKLKEQANSLKEKNLHWQNILNKSLNGQKTLEESETQLTKESLNLESSLQLKRRELPEELNAFKLDSPAEWLKKIQKLRDRQRALEVREKSRSESEHEWQKLKDEGIKRKERILQLEQTIEIKNAFSIEIYKKFKGISCASTLADLAQSLKVSLQAIEHQNKLIYELDQKCAKTNLEYQELIQRSQESTHSFKPLNEKLEQEEKSLDLMSTQLKLQELIKHSLHQGVCEICDSVVGPELEKKLIKQESYNDQKTLTEKLRKKVQDLEKEIAVLNSQKNQTEQIIKEFENEKKQRQNNLTDLFGKFDYSAVELPLILEQINQSLPLVQKNENERQQISTQVEIESRELTDLREKFKNLSKEIEGHDLALKEEKKELTHQVSQFLRELNLPNKLNQLELREIEELIFHYFETNKIEQALYEVKDKLNLNQKQKMTNAQDLSEAQQKMLQLSEEKSQNHSTVMAIWTQLLSLESELGLALNADEKGLSANDFDQVYQLFQKHLQEKRKLRAADEKALQEMRSHKEQLEGLLGGLKDQLKDQKQLLVVHQTNLKALIQPIKEKLSPKWSDKILSFDPNELTREIIDLIQDYFFDEFTPFTQKVKLNLNNHKQKMIEIESQLKLYRLKSVERNEKIEDRKKINQTLNLKQELFSLIGKDEFRNFALSLIETDLVALTNQELSHLCDGRYQLKLVDSTYGPEFYIIDFWKEASSRKIDTLSGGETFLVSLAMALSLAEMSRGQTEIDSFFIDEGFGTLDQDSLEDALEILMNLEARGKQLGIISHVKDLTDRIAVNIHLKRGPLGVSEIETIYQ